jgi:epoxyqueuosine reductase
MDRISLSRFAKQKAQELGFAMVGIAQDTPTAAADFYDWWTEQGFGGEMSYLQRHRQKKRSLQGILPNARAALVCALAFPGGSAAQTADQPAGKIARYAQGRDYHFIIKEKLDQLVLALDQVGKPLLPSQAFVDSAPINERSLAAAAGLGWIGKNAMLINPQYGSWFWLGEVVTQLDLVADQAISDRCGTCRKCIDACPTTAILEDKRAIDARKCISYLTIEKRGEIPAEHKAAIGDWLIGCDICQEVCPWNNHSLKHGRQDLGPAPLELAELAGIENMNELEFKQSYGIRAIARTKLAGLKRNAQIVKDNLG